MKLTDRDARATMGPPDESSSSLINFDRLIAEYGDRIYSTALRMTGSVSDAEEILQDTLLEAFEHRESFRGEASPTTWVYRIAVNQARQRIRQRRPVAYLEATGYDETRIFDWSCDLARRVEASELRQELERGITRLTEDVRLVLVLRDVDGLTAGEVSQILGITEAA